MQQEGDAWVKQKSAARPDEAQALNPERTRSGPPPGARDCSLPRSIARASDPLSQYSSSIHVSSTSCDSERIKIRKGFDPRCTQAY